MNSIQSVNFAETRMKGSEARLTFALWKTRRLRFERRFVIDFAPEAIAQNP